jgi:hypothetical protein
VRRKDQLKTKVVELVELSKGKGRFVKYESLDDDGENAAIVNACKHNYLEIKFEFSGPRTPQRNVKVERKFQALYGSVRLILNDSEIKE